MEKESCLAYARRTFTGQALALIEKQISLFFDESAEICRTRYQVGDAVQLRKGTFMHGIFGELDNFDYTVSHGFVSADFTGTARPNKFFHSVGMWNLRGDIRLCDYIRSYSGFTIAYTVGRGPGAKLVTELIPYHGFDAFVDRINNDENIWTYWGDKTKEISFLPSLASEKRQIGFLLNMESD